MSLLDFTQPPAPIDNQSVQAPTTGAGAPGAATDPNDPQALMRKAMLARMLMSGNVNPGMALGLAMSQGMQNGGMGKGGGAQPAAPNAAMIPAQGSNVT
jgi:hypothetical protein